MLMLPENRNLLIERYISRDPGSNHCNMIDVIIIAMLMIRPIPP
jgi:hypothetical protein